MLKRPKSDHITVIDDSKNETEVALGHKILVVVLLVEVMAKSQLNRRLLVVATKMKRKFHQNEKEITRSQNETEISPK